MMYFFRPKPTVCGVTILMYPPIARLDPPQHMATAGVLGQVLGAVEYNSLVLREDRGMEGRNRYWGGSGYR